MVPSSWGRSGQEGATDIRGRVSESCDGAAVSPSFAHVTESHSTHTISKRRAGTTCIKADVQFLVMIKDSSLAQCIP